jgi:hypothetical protein
MDPTLAPGQREQLTESDIIAFGLMGWDVPTDCNNNSVPDPDDISGGASQDCNANGVPDECDIDDDTSEDCNINGIPDECETDCNANGVPDNCDVVHGGAPDCNGNLNPDECDIASGASEDCNLNGIPDECETDCNANGIPDECDIAGGLPDCNTNGVPDSCDIASGTSEDTNIDGIPDECQSLSAGPGPGIGALRVWAAPNPFGPRTGIAFELPEPAAVRLTVYDLRGRQIRLLAEDDYAQGLHTVSWDGNTGAGSPAASGIYYLAARLGSETRLVKLTLMR